MRRALLSFTQSKSQLFQEKKRTFFESDLWISVKHWAWRLVSCRTSRRRNNLQTLFGLGRTARSLDMPAQNLNDMLGEKNDNLRLDDGDEDLNSNSEVKTETEDREESLGGDGDGLHVIEDAPDERECNAISRPRSPHQDNSQSDGLQLQQSHGKAKDGNGFATCDTKVDEARVRVPSQFEINVTTNASTDVTHIPQGKSTPRESARLKNEIVVERTLASSAIDTNVTASSPQISLTTDISGPTSSSMEQTILGVDVRTQEARSKSESTGHTRRSTPGDRTHPLRDGDGLQVPESRGALKRVSVRWIHC